MGVRVIIYYETVVSTDGGNMIGFGEGGGRGEKTRLVQTRISSSCANASNNERYVQTYKWSGDRCNYPGNDFPHTHRTKLPRAALCDAGNRTIRCSAAAQEVEFRFQRVSFDGTVDTGEQ